MWVSARGAPACTGTLYSCRFMPRLTPTMVLRGPASTGAEGVDRGRELDGLGRSCQILHIDPVRVLALRDAGASEGEGEGADGAGKRQLLRVSRAELDGDGLDESGLVHALVGELVDGEDLHVL